MSEMVERVGEALRKECLDVFGATWSNDVTWRLARAAIEAMASDKTSCGVCGCAIYPKMEKALSHAEIANRMQYPDAKPQ